jgi:hypothetical protein
MSDRKLLLIVLLVAAAASFRCSASPSEPEGNVIITQTTTTTTTIPIAALSAGAIGTSPTGTALAAATVVAFAFRTPPSGGVEPYSVAWNFGDGEQGSGNSPSHVYMATGDFPVVVTVADAAGKTAQASTTVSVRSVTGRWTTTFSGAGPMPERIDLIQDQTAVTATTNDAANLLGFGSGTGNVSNPRSLAVSITFRAGTPLAFAATYVGRIDDTLTTWTGTVTGHTGCPCTFTATRPTPSP